ncbi:MAG TPA: potassium channel protein [Byssovorax sp.]
MTAPRRRLVGEGPLRDAAIRLATAASALAGAVLLGGIVLFALGRGRWTFGDSLYFAINAVSTVGFRELDGTDHVPFSRPAIIGIIVLGLGTVAYFQSSLTALLVQGVVLDRYRLRRMQARIDALEDHVIVTGAGATGMHVVEELHQAKSRFVVVDRSREVCERLSRDACQGSMLYVIGDATDDAVLLEAGIRRAMGVVAALTEDKDNLFVTLSARSLNARARIVSKCIGPDAAQKMLRAGANATVSPNMIGGRRLASEIVRPALVSFMDRMLRDHEALRLEEVALADGSSFAGKTLAELPIRADQQLLVVAVRADGKSLNYPDGSTEMLPGSVLIVLGATANIAKLRDALG